MRVAATEAAAEAERAAEAEAAQRAAEELRRVAQQKAEAKARRLAEAAKAKSAEAEAEAMRVAAAAARAARPTSPPPSRPTPASKSPRRGPRTPPAASDVGNVVVTPPAATSPNDVAHHVRARTRRGPLFPGTEPSPSRQGLGASVLAHASSPAFLSSQAAEHSPSGRAFRLDALQMPGPSSPSAYPVDGISDVSSVRQAHPRSSPPYLSLATPPRSGLVDIDKFIRSRRV